MEQSRDEEQGNHGDAGTQVRQGEIRQQRDGAAASGAEVAADADESIEGGVYDGARVEAVGFERVFGMALRAASGAMLVRRGGEVGCALGSGDSRGSLLRAAGGFLAAKPVDPPAHTLLDILSVNTLLVLVPVPG